MCPESSITQATAKMQINVLRTKMYSFESSVTRAVRDWGPGIHTVFAVWTSALLRLSVEVGTPLLLESL